MGRRVTGNPTDLPPPPDRQEYTMNNLVAKHAHKYNRAKVFKSKKDYSRKRKDWFK